MPMTPATLKQQLVFSIRHTDKPGGTGSLSDKMTTIEIHGSL